MKRAIITQTALPACGFVLKKFHAFGWRVYRNFRVLQRVALAFQWNDTVASENENIFIAICYWRKLLKIWFGSQRVLLYNSTRAKSVDVLNQSSHFHSI